MINLEQLAYRRPDQSQQELWQVDFSLREEEQEQEAESDPYAWMNAADRWMIGKAADKACWQYIDRMIETRERNARTIVPIYVASCMPPPLNVVMLAIAMLVRVSSKRTRGRS